MFASLDLVVNTILTLPITGAPARIGLKFYNLTRHENARDMQRDIFRSDFGHTYNLIHCGIRGMFEIVWGGQK